jgi:hypothetical protein
MLIEGRNRNGGGWKEIGNRRESKREMKKKKKDAPDTVFSFLEKNTDTRKHQNSKRNALKIY